MIVKAEDMHGVFAKAQLQTKWENGKTEKSAMDMSEFSREEKLVL